MTSTVSVVGAGPAGLMAAEVMAEAGLAVTVYDRMPNFGRKLLLAGRGGLNLTHSEPLPALLPRYREASAPLTPYIEAFPPLALRAWAEGLGEPTFVGSSGRVFPKSFKTSPLLRAWLARLEAGGVRFERRARFAGWDTQGRVLLNQDGNDSAPVAQPTVLALGGASWPRLGSDGSWIATFTAAGISVTPFVAANCGVEIGWSAMLVEKHAGTPLKRIAVALGDTRVTGEALLTANGLEGGAVYALVPDIRTRLAEGAVTVMLDLRPDLTLEAVRGRLEKPRGSASLSNHLRKALGLAPVAIALLNEARPLPANPAALALRVKAVPLQITDLRPIERAISSAGGVPWSELDSDLMLKRRPGTFLAGEMIDWEAPTGGYLLQAVFATGRAAGLAAARFALGRP